MEAPELQRAFQDFGADGVVFLGVFVVSTDEDIRKFAERFQLTFPVGRDNGISQALGVSGIPETIFIHPEGSIASRHRGAIDYEELREGISGIFDLGTTQPQ